MQAKELQLKKALRNILIALMIGVAGLNSYAERVEPATAQRVAATFLNNNGVRSNQLTNVSERAGFPNLYIFNGEQGFVIMAADDRVKPILGYSLTGRFVAENMPENLRWWLQGYNDEIQYAVDNQLRASTETFREWEDLAQGRSDVAIRMAVVEPLIQTEWGQQNPYNLQCPTGCVTGCVATAMAQIMKRWNYPEQGQNSHTNINDFSQTVNFGATTYDWSNMTNTYNNENTDEQKQAVAVLMFHCGVATNMNYGSTMSSTSDIMASIALKDYFRYANDARFAKRNDIGNDDVWISLMKGELDAGRPMLYGGDNNKTGNEKDSHAFVCDGYDNNDCFHFNWGWNGEDQNMFFSIITQNGMNPGTHNFSYNQDMIYGIRPLNIGCTAPTNLVWSGTGRDLTLSWTAVEGVASYRIYRNGVLIEDAASGTTYTDNNLENGKYQYYLRSNCTESGISAPSNILEVNVSCFTITATSNPTAGGTISGAGTYNENSECTLVATPNDHYAFTNWTKNGVVVSTNPTYTFTVTADETYTANFTAMPQFTITAIANPAAGGIVSGARTYDGNSQCTLKAMPNAHYRFSNWTKNGIQISTNSTYTFTVTADGTYTANFSSLNSHAITCNTVENGTISANPTTAYLGETVTLTANPDSEYGFSEWIVKDANNNLITVTNNRFIMPDSDVTVSAIFTHLSYILYNSSILFALNDYTMTAELIKQWIGFGNGNLIIPSSISTTNQQNQTLVYDVTSIHDGAFNGCHGYTGDLIIPNSVVSIGANAFADCYGFTGSLEIPNSVVSIGDYAFIGCYGFTGNLNIPNSVMTIGSRAFENCSGFTDNLTIGESVVEIGNLAFNHCDGLTSLDFNAINCVYVGFVDDFWLKDCSSLSGLTIGQNVEHIPNYFAYKYSGFIGDLIIPNSVVSIGKYAFYDCGGFSGSLILGSSVTTIGEDAFCRCSNFTGGLTIPNSVITIGDRAFAVCSGFTGDLIIPNSVTTIGKDAFANCSGFTGSLTIPNSVTTIDYGAFYNCSGLTGSLTIPHSVTSLGELVFENCSFDGLNLDMIPNCNYGYGSYCNVVEYLGGSFTGDLAIGNSVTTIYHDAFNYCSGFTGSLSIGNSVTTISSSAFRNCSGFSGDLVIPNSVTTIGLSAFSGCNGFTGSLSIGNSVTSIGTQAFEGCSGFNGNLIIGNSVTEIGYAAFQNCSGFSGDLIIPNSVTSIEEYAFDDCSGLNGTLSLPNALAKISHAAFANCGFVGELILPNTITSIELNAFLGCNGFTGNLEIPNSVTKIENGAFRNCSGFTGDLVIPNSVTIIGGTSYSFGVFDGCSGFNGNLMIGNSVTAIDNYTFQGCSGLTGDVVIPNSVTSIGKSAFSDCSSLNGDLSIPICVTSIGANAFASCDNLSSIHSYNAVPPTLGNNAFNGVNTSIPVYVPSCSATDYSNAAQWSNFTNYQATLPCVPTFTGNGMDNLWSNPDNWSAQPDGNYDIIISANCEVNEDVEASSVIINNTGTLVVKSGHVLTISGNSSKSGNTLEGEIVNHGTAANLIIEDGGQLVYNQNGLQGTIQKNISYYTLEGNDGWHLVAYPLVENGSVSSQSNMLNNSYDLYYYDEPTHYWRNYKNASNSFTQLEAGKGYLYANSGVITPIGTRVGNGTGATAYSPFYTYYKFSISENLFRATELETAGLSTSPLGSLCWYATNSTGYEQSGISIWMANVSDSELTETSHLTDGMTLVYTGSMTPVVGWNEFVFNENTFAWDGTSNILVCVQRNNGQWNDKIYWQTHNPGFASKSQQYTDDAAYDMTTQTYSMSVSTNYRPNTIFKTVSEVGVVEQTPIQISFAGELENGAANINLPLSYTESAGGLKGFNLVGNPFVHNVTSFVRTNVAEECYRMNAAKDNLIVSEVSASKPLKPAEGFFVKATAEGASITFNSGAKGETNRSGRINIELRENDPSTSSRTLLIDRLIVKREGEPLEKMSLKENGTRIFAANGNQEMAVVTAEGKEQTVSFKAAKNGTYTLSANVENMSVDYLQLIDNLTGADVNLLVSPEYTFNAKTSDYTSRFRLVFSENGGASTGAETFAFISNGEIRLLVETQNFASLQVVDVLGRVIRSTDGVHTVSTSGIPAGVYVLRLIEGNDVKTQKLVIE